MHPYMYLVLAAERWRMFEREVDHDRRVAEVCSASQDAERGYWITVLDLMALFRRGIDRGGRAHRSAQKEG